MDPLWLNIFPDLSEMLVGNYDSLANRKIKYGNEAK